ncbi:hypothetical protein Tco_1283710 [Tanacetum coccineum]
MDYMHEKFRDITHQSSSSFHRVDEYDVPVRMSNEDDTGLTCLCNESLQGRRVVLGAKEDAWTRSQWLNSLVRNLIWIELRLLTFNGRSTMTRSNSSSRRMLLESEFGAYGLCFSENTQDE